jgi:hypothetical protein
MIKHTLFLIFIIQMACFIVYAETENSDEKIQPSDSTQNLDVEKNESTDTGKVQAQSQDTTQSEKLTKKQLRAKKRKERKEFNDMTISAHKSMLIGSSDHKHGFTKKKKGGMKGPLQPQTLCPVMGGPIDKRFYYDYNGMRIYVCCEGCVYQLKRTPELYVKTLKRYGEKPIKVPEEETEKLEK